MSGLELSILNVKKTGGRHEKCLPPVSLCREKFFNEADLILSGGILLKRLVQMENHVQILAVPPDGHGKVVANAELSADA